MNYVSIENISKSFGIKILFQEVTFGIDKGDKIALVAKNGTGKSTLLKIIRPFCGFIVPPFSTLLPFQSTTDT